MSPDERAEFNELKQTVNDMAAFIQQHFNEDGTPKQPPIVIEADGNGSTPGGSVRVQTNLGPKDFIVV